MSFNLARGYPLGTTIEVSEMEALTKGVLIVGDGTGAPTSLAVGANDTVLTAASAEASGVKWGTAATNKSIIIMPQMHAIGEPLSSTVTGSGANSIDAGYMCTTGATNPSTARIRYLAVPDNEDQGNFIFDNNPILTGWIQPTTLTGDGELWAIVGGINDTDSTVTTKHIGFVMEIVSGTTTLYGSNANGTTQTKTDLGVTMTSTEGHLLQAVMSSGTNVKFYVDGLLVGTSTTNLPSGSTTFLGFNCGVETTSATSRNCRFKTFCINYDITDNT